MKLFSLVCCDNIPWTTTNSKCIIYYPKGPLLYLKSWRGFCSFVNATGTNVAKKIENTISCLNNTLFERTPSSYLCCIFSHSLEGKTQSKLIPGVTEEMSRGILLRLKFFSHKTEKVANFAPVIGCTGASCFAP